jgi:alpha 1,6-mannosyltransferase
VSQWTPAALEPFGLGVGIEAGPDRPDWHDWYARRIQFCQWTIMSKPGHPVSVDIVASITEETLERKTRDELEPTSMKTVMEFTGPGIWTDSIFTYLNITQLREDSTSSTPPVITWQLFAIEVSDVFILPFTSFSPGVGHMGSRSTDDRLAFINHGLSGDLLFVIPTWEQGMC